MSAVVAGWLLTGIAVGLLVAGVPLFAFVVACTAAVVVFAQPDPDHEDAQRRNQAWPR